MANRIESLKTMIAEREALLGVTPLCNEIELEAICDELEALEALEAQQRELEACQRLASIIVEREFLDLVRN